MKIIFVSIIFVWLFFGFCMIWNCKKDDPFHSGIFAALFMGLMPAIPLIAHICGLI